MQQNVSIRVNTTILGPHPKLYEIQVFPTLMKADSNIQKKLGYGPLIQLQLPHTIVPFIDFCFLGKFNAYFHVEGVHIFVILWFLLTSLAHEKCAIFSSPERPTHGSLP
jgi:hypothetical protein